MPARKPAHVASRWEWVAAAISALLVMAMIALLVVGGATADTPPGLTVRTDSVTAGEDAFLAHFTVRNDGTQSVASLQIEGELWQADTLLENSRATLDYVPGRAARYGGLFFTRDPRAHALRIRAVGYERP